MNRDVITVGSTKHIPLLYRGEYSQWHERFMNYLEEQTDGEAMTNSIQNGDQPLPVIVEVSLAGTTQNAAHTLKDPKFWTAEEKKTRKIDRLARSLLIQGLPNEIYSLIDSNKTAKDLWDALERQMRGSEYGAQDRKAQNQGDVNDALGYKKKVVAVTSDPLALITEKTKVRNHKEKVKVQIESKGSDDEDINSDESSLSAEETIVEVAYYTSESESESEYETSEYYDNSTNYGLFVNNNDDQEIFHNAIESASENFIENHIYSQKDYDTSEVDHNDFEEKEHLIDKL
nr:hypothetical protein [Tanacetum cinerariifolium]